MQYFRVERFFIRRGWRKRERRKTSVWQGLSTSSSSTSSSSSSSSLHFKLGRLPPPAVRPPCFWDLNVVLCVGEHWRPPTFLFSVASRRERENRRSEVEKFTKTEQSRENPPVGATMGRRGRRRRRRKKKKSKKEEEDWISSNWLLEADRRKHPIRIVCEMSPTDLRKKKKTTFFCCVWSFSSVEKKKKKKSTECLWPLMHDSTSCLSTGDRRSNQRRRPGDSFPANAWFDFQTFSTGGCACFFSFSSLFIPSDWLVSVLGRNAIISGPSNYSQPGRVGLSAPSIKLQTDHCTCFKMGK